MATLQEIMAKKKAEAAAATTAPQAPTPAPTPAPTKAPEMLAVLEEANKEEEKKLETPLATTKPLSFAEKMALKRAQDAAAQNTSSPATATSTTATESPKAEAPITSPAPSAEMRESPAANIPVSNDTTTPKQDADPETAQAYADIAARIKALNDLSDTPLENAMKELKKALMANPNAVSLMLDTDYGQMVIALRRLTKQDQIEAEADKKKGGNGRKKKVDFTNPDEVQAVFDEL